MTRVFHSRPVTLRSRLVALENRLQRLPAAVRLTILTVPVLLLAAGYYLWRWHSVAEFVLAVDHHEQLFQDFLGHYYPMGRAVTGSSVPVPGYFYSAFFALLLMPLSTLEPNSAMWAWGAVQVVGLVLLFALPLFRLLPLKPLGTILYTAVFATCFPLLHNTKWGQVSVLLTVCIIAAFHAYKSNRRILTGVLLAFAAAIKYYPAVFLLYFVLKRDLRACLGAAMALAVFFIAFPVAVMGPHAWVTFEVDTIKGLLRAAGWMSQDVNSQYFVHVLIRWMHMAGLQQGPGATATSILEGLGFLVFLGNLGVLRRMQRIHMPGRFVLSLVMLFLSLPFVIKTSWPHSFSYLPFCQMVILMYALRIPPAAGLRRGALLALPLLSMVGSSVLFFSAFPHWYAYNNVGTLFAANLLLLISVYIMALAGLRRPWWAGDLDG